MAQSIIPQKPVIPWSECHICIGVAGEVYIFHKPTQTSWMSQTALAKLCQVDQSTLSKLGSATMTKSYPEKLQTLLDGRFLTMTRFENPNNLQGAEPFVCFDADDSWLLLTYAAYFSRGHEQRQQAKLAAVTIGKAGMTAYILNQAGYTLTPHLEPERDDTKYITGTWDETRNAGIEPRKAFNSLCKQLGKDYARYTDKCYSALFACTAQTLIKKRSEPVKGSRKIARNYIDEVSELTAVTRLEEMVVSMFEPGMSLTRLIIFFAPTVLAELGLPQPDRRRHKEWKMMCESLESTQKRLKGGY